MSSYGKSPVTAGHNSQHDYSIPIQHDCSIPLQHDRTPSGDTQLDRTRTQQRDYSDQVQLESTPFNSFKPDRAPYNYSSRLEGLSCYQNFQPDRTPHNELRQSVYRQKNGPHQHDLDELDVRNP